jgi:DNA-binding NarL/FixJ family response regulator
VLTRILIAEDHGVMRTTLRTLLETHADWHVAAEAANGLEAVRKAAEVKPDVVLLDFAMPEADGLQAAREISAAWPEVPILIYTGCAFSPEAKREVKRMGVWEVVNKEAPPALLIRAVEALLTERRQSTPSAETLAPPLHP